MKLKGSQYPEKFDTDENLYLVKDALKVPLGLDHLPGNNFIAAEGDISRFPPSGIITLLDQGSAVHERATSFYYGRRTNREFLDIELLPNCNDGFKPKKLTIITMQVMSDHRESLKESILAIENFLGTKHDKADQPNSGSIFSRINFLRELLLAPKAWFEMDKTTGIAPLTVNFKFTGTGNKGPIGEVTYSWDFGDGEEVTTNPNFQKIFIKSGIYDAKLKVKNHYGEDEVIFKNIVDVRSIAPQQALIEFRPQPNQLYQPAQPEKGIPLKIRTPINQPVNVMVSPKSPVSTVTSAGELIELTNNKVLDPVTSYTWNLGDDMFHNNTPHTKAIYGVGGLYDMVLRTDTEGNAYRVTVYDNCIDVVEPTNLWLWSINDNSIKSHEFGLVSETFKTSYNEHPLQINDSFLGSNREKFEFYKNNGMAKANEVKSGDGGDCLLFYASGRGKEDSSANEQINFISYNGFIDSYTTKGSVSRPWNWASLVSPNNVYFILGNPVSGPYPTLSPTNQTKTTLDIKSFSFSDEDFQYKSFKSGAHELTRHLGIFDDNFIARHGYFSVCRTAWKGSVGYILRNGELGEGLSLVDFYKTEGTIGAPFQNIVKLPDLPGNNHREGELTPLNNGIYFFSNNGSSYCFNDLTNTWELVNSHNRIARNELNSLLAASDSDNRAYVNINELNNGFFKFNAIDLSYTTLTHPPIEKQWLLGVY